jgi:hypothetical protein
VRLRKDVDRCKKDGDYLCVSHPKPRHPHKTELFRMVKLGKALDSEKSSEVHERAARLIIRS